MRRSSDGSEEKSESGSADDEGAESASGDEEPDGVESESEDAANDAGTGGGLMEEEEKAEGVVKLTIYSTYWKAVGACLAPSVLLALLLMQGSCRTRATKLVLICWHFAKWCLVFS